MKADMSPSWLSKVALAFGALALATWMIAEDGFYASMRYGVCLLAIVANGTFVLRLLENPRVRSRIIASTLLMVLANCWVGYLVFPKLGLIVGFWIPTGAGLLVGFFSRRYGRRA